MKSSSKKITTNQFVLFAIANLFLISCGTYQSVYTDDGIYGSSKGAQKAKKIRIVDDEAYENNENEYFTKELERLDYANETAIFTDVDAYNSQDVAYEEDALNYNTNPAWGSNGNNNVVVRVNLRNDSYWNDFGWNNNRFNNFGWNNNRYNNWGYGSRWGWNNGFNNWGYNPFWNPYQNNIGFGWGFNNPYYGGFMHPYAAYQQNEDGFYGNTRNQRRVSYNSNYRRSNRNARSALSKRVTSTTSNAIRKFNSKRLKVKTAKRRAASGKAISSTRRRTSSTRSPSSSSSSTRRNSSSTRSPSSSSSSTRRNSSSTRSPSSSSSSTRRNSSSTRSPSSGSSSTRRSSSSTRSPSSSSSSSRRSSSSSRSSSRGSSSPSGSRRSN